MKAPRTFLWIVLTVLCCFLVLFILFRTDIRLDSILLEIIINILLAFLGMMATLYCLVEQKKAEASFQRILFNFFALPVPAAGVTVLLFLCILLLFGDRSTSEAKPPAAVPPAVPAQPPYSDQDEPSAEPEYYLPLSAWESNPFIMRLDEYVNRPVDDAEMDEVLSRLFESGIREIEVRGYYNFDVLNGADSDFARKIEQAQDSRRAFDLLRTADAGKQYWEKMLKDAIEFRIAADGLYNTSNNRMMIGDLYLLLAETGFEFEYDTNQIFDWLTEAFSYFQYAIHTNFAEGYDEDIQRELILRLQNTSDKMQSLSMDREERTMAPRLANTYERIFQSKTIDFGNAAYDP